MYSGTTNFYTLWVVRSSLVTGSVSVVTMTAQVTPFPHMSLQGSLTFLSVHGDLIQVSYGAVNGLPDENAVP